MKLTNDNLTSKSAVICEYWIFNRAAVSQFRAFICRVCLEYERNTRNKRIKRREWVKVKEARSRDNESAERITWMEQCRKCRGKNDEKAPGWWNSGAHFANLLAASTLRFVLSTWTNDNGRNASLLFRRHVFKPKIFIAPIIYLTR